MNQSSVTDINESCLDEYRQGYADLFIRHHASRLGWSEQFTALATRDGLRFLALCAHGETDTANILICSPIVDEIVDAIFLDVPLLMWLERVRFGGVRLMHVPAYAHGTVDPAVNNARYEATVAMMSAAGFKVDRDIVWPRRLVNYRPCSVGGGWDDCLVKTFRKAS